MAVGREAPQRAQPMAVEEAGGRKKRTALWPYRHCNAYAGILRG